MYMHRTMAEKCDERIVELHNDEMTPLTFGDMVYPDEDIIIPTSAVSDNSRIVNLVTLKGVRKLVMENVQDNEGIQDDENDEDDLGDEDDRFPYGIEETDPNSNGELVI